MRPEPEASAMRRACSLGAAAALLLAVLGMLRPGLGRGNAEEEPADPPAPSSGVPPAEAPPSDAPAIAPATAPAAPPAPAQGDADAPPAAAPARLLPAWARIVGQNVNVRVGPRIAGDPVARLDAGALVRVVETLPSWYGVHLPRGFKAAVAARYVAVESRDRVRVVADRLNLRAGLPRGEVLGAPFADPVPAGTLLEVAQPEGEWLWVLAPEATRVYIHADYVEFAEFEAEALQREVEAAHAERASWLDAIRASRHEVQVERANEALRQMVGEVQSGLHACRLAEGHDRAPIVVLANQMDAALERHAIAGGRLRRLALALREDLEAEIQLRVARRDAALARARGLATPPPALPAPRVSQVRVTGTLHFESVPAWRTGGAWILSVDEVPTHVVRLTTGMPLPHPQLEAYVGIPKTYTGRQPGERLFGLPVLDLERVEPPVPAQAR